MQILRSINQQEEKEIREMQKRQRNLHLIPTPVCYLGIDVMDKSGDVVAKYEDRSKSWVRNFYNWMVTQQMTCNLNILGDSFGAGTLTLKEKSAGVIRSAAYPAYHSLATHGVNYNGYRAAASSTSYGILIGTSDAAESFESYTLGELITEGTDAGQMQYQGMSTPTPVWAGSPDFTMTYACERIIINNSGEAIIVKEAGLVASITAQAGSSMILMARDVLAVPVSVPHESQIKVTYTIQITYPE